MIISIITSLLVCFFLRLIFVIGNTSTDDWGHFFYLQLRKQYKNPFNYKALNSIIKGNKAYPQLFHYLVSLFPNRNEILIGRLFNIFLDCVAVVLTIFVAFYFFNSISLEYNEQNLVYLGLILATSPILLPTNARMISMGARVFGYVLFLIFLSLSFFILNTSTITDIVVLSIGLVIMLHLIVISSSFALQITIWTSCILSVAYLNILYFFLILTSFFLLFKNNYFGTQAVLSSKLAHWKWYFHNAQNNKTPIFKPKWNEYIYLPLWIIKNPLKAAGFCLRKSSIIITLYSILPFYLLIIFITLDHQLLIYLLSQPLTKFCVWVIVAAAIACFLTSFKSLQFLGQAERYFEYVMPFLAFLYFYVILYQDKSQHWLLYLIIFQILGVLANYIWINYPRDKNLFKFSISPSFKEVIDYLKKQKPLNIITIQTKLSFYIYAYLPKLHKYYFRFIDEPKRGHEYMNEDHVDFDLIRPDFKYFNKKYAIDTVVISKKYFQVASDKGVYYDIKSYKIVLENDDYMILSIS